MGRTELQDAVPMTVGQEFYAFASSLQNEIQWLKDSEKPLYVENMGATAIGTGINVPKGYAEKFAEHLSKLLNKPIGARYDRRNMGSARFCYLFLCTEESGYQALEDIE
jgi:aspartate ammonia-lyase